MENTTVLSKQGKITRKRAPQLRTPRQHQLFLERLICDFQIRNPLLTPRDPGYIPGQQTPNPYYWNLSDRDRATTLLNALRMLVTVCGDRELEERADKLEKNYGQLVELLQHKALHLFN